MSASIIATILTLTASDSAGAILTLIGKRKKLGLGGRELDMVGLAVGRGIVLPP